MTIIVEVIEPRVHMGKWVGNVTMSEILEATEKTQQDATDNNYETYIFVIDARELQSFPFEISSLGKVTKINSTSLAYVILGAPRWTRNITKILRLFSVQDFIHVETYEQALETARSILKKQKTDSN